MQGIWMTVTGLLVLGTMSAFGAPQTVCTKPNDNITIANLAGINAAGYLCGDKIFSNFTSSGGIDGSVFIREINTSTYELSFTGAGSGFSSAFTFGYTVAVDTVNFPLLYISQVQDSMLTNRAAGGADSIPNASTATVTHTPGGTVNLDAMTAPDQNGLANMLTQSETILFSYNPNGNIASQPAGNFLSVDYVASQTQIPEPLTFSLVGVGLVGLGVSGHKRRVKT